MSVVTDIILVSAIDDEMMNDFIELSAIKFTKVDHLAGGNKAMQCDLYIAAQNYLNKELLLEYFYGFTFEDNDSAQIMLKEEEDFVFKQYRRIA